MKLENKDYAIMGLGILLIAVIWWLIRATTAVTPVGEKQIVITEIVRTDTVIKQGATVIKKVPMKETILIDNTDTLKIKALLAAVDSLEKNLISMRVEKKLSIDTIYGANSDTISLVVDVYKKQLDTLSIARKPIIIPRNTEVKYIPRSSTETWLLIGAGAVGTLLLCLIFGGK